MEESLTPISPTLHRHRSICIVKFLPVLAPLALFIWAGMAGVDQGRHWEQRFHLETLEHMLNTKSLLPGGAKRYEKYPGLQPGNYAYPSMIYWVHLASILPEWLTMKSDAGPEQLKAFLYSPAFTFRLRGVCILLSSLTIVWVYLAVLVWRKRWIEATFAASLVACSWEVSYHSRWVAPDTLVMQFGAMCLFFCIAALSGVSRPGLFLKLAACAAGLATGTKYPAGILLLPVSIAALFVWDRKSGLRSLFFQQALLLGIMVITFLITTPGAILQMTCFLNYLQYQRNLYGAAGHYGYTISHSSDLLCALLEYLALVLFSHYWPIAAVVSCLVLIGSIAVLKQTPKVAALLLVCPFVYIAYFSSQKVMIVRNYMILVPFLAILAATGLSCILSRFSSIATRIAITTCLFVPVLINAAWLVDSSRNITVQRSLAGQITEACRYMREHPDNRYYLSPQVRNQLTRCGECAFESPPVSESDDKRQELIVALASEGGEAWPANVRNFSLRWFGSYEVNWNYYPTWIGGDRVVLLTPDNARRCSDVRIQRLLLEHDLLQRAPDGCKLGPYLACGIAAQDVRHGITLRRMNGSSWTFPRARRPFEKAYGTVSWDPAELRISIKGLNPKQSYLVGFAWCDLDKGGRLQSVYAAPANQPKRSLLLGATRLPTWIRVDGTGGDFAIEHTCLLPRETYIDGSAILSVRREGPVNVVLSAIWVLEAPATGTGFHPVSGSISTRGTRTGR